MLADQFVLKGGKKPPEGTMMKSGTYMYDIDFTYWFFTDGSVATQDSHGGLRVSSKEAYDKDLSVPENTWH